ncbi:1-acyl-sn-glycerol-3-phosphate acyltransferase 3-like isoform X2 [Humulus lupulus]|uniref:1-acyl-sn-glycerol-3-phosphate acyltransferase 3-like isoform X2 n=1 Tax=Humulus lupulus TaxID=3486 RepID=UPI002B412D3B|nr:1-acyl-sn-glycerol-3-phosphate acyltransferase 3-like isoform X2 [Humulus lupulus]
MAVPAALVIVPLGILVICSGTLVNFLQAVFFVLVRPLSKSMYKRINKGTAELLWLELIWFIDWWAAIKVELYTDSETFQFMGKENALVISNHKGDIDWLVGWVLAQRSGCLGSSVAIMRKEAKFLPIIGWSMWLSDYIFLETKWDKDEVKLKSGFQQLEDFPMPFWLALFVEGTRFTQPKLAVAQHYAASRGLPIPKNVLIPRTKGFVSAVSYMRSFVPAIYDCTVTTSKNQHPPTLLSMFRGETSVVKVQLKRFLMHELPETDDGIAQWCRDIFVTKVVISWSCLIVCGYVKLFQWLSVFSSWEGTAFSVAVLVLVTIVIQILICAYESELFTPNGLPLQDPIRQALIQNYAEIPYSAQPVIM